MHHQLFEIRASERLSPRAWMRAWFMDTYETIKSAVTWPTRLYRSYRYTSRRSREEDPQFIRAQILLKVAKWLTAFYLMLSVGTAAITSIAYLHTQDPMVFVWLSAACVSSFGLYAAAESVRKEGWTLHDQYAPVSGQHAVDGPTSLSVRQSRCGHHEIRFRVVYRKVPKTHAHAVSY